MKAINTDILAGALGLLITVIFWQARENWLPLSATWPNTILVFMFLVSLVLIGKGFVVAERAPVFVEGSRRRMLITAASLLVWAVGVRYVGFVTTSFVVFMWLWWYVATAVAETEGSPEDAPRSVLDYLRAAAVLAVVIGAFYLTFTRVLYVPLPRGLII